MIYRSSISGPRWSGFQSALKLKMEVDKHWLTEDIRWEVTGPEAAVKRFVAGVSESIRDFNAPSKPTA